ncbi:hypothetical protein AABB24_027803 [Solanum stoloniferum]|uniref:Uncharacterized protein n=1 Tax=Solanum stoloniferum TaxID=62892 RepID=A0ABD2S478_9SOLN
MKPTYKMSCLLISLLIHGLMMVDYKCFSLSAEALKSLDRDKGGVVSAPPTPEHNVGRRWKRDVPPGPPPPSPVLGPPSQSPPPSTPTLVSPPPPSLSPPPSTSSSSSPPPSPLALVSPPPPSSSPPPPSSLSSPPPPPSPVPTLPSLPPGAAQTRWWPKAKIKLEALKKNYKCYYFKSIFLAF